MHIFFHLQLNQLEELTFNYKVEIKLNIIITIIDHIKKIWFFDILSSYKNYYIINKSIIIYIIAHL